MAQEDDLRALGKIMDFMRGISVLFLLINCYWFCYSAFETWNFTLAIIDKILLNFQRTTGLFSSMLWTKLFSVVFLGLSCLGTKGVKEEKITWGMIYSALAVGFVLFFLNYCCPLNFKTTRFPYPQRPSIGVADSFFEK